MLKGFLILGELGQLEWIVILCCFDNTEVLIDKDQRQEPPIPHAPDSEEKDSGKVEKSKEVNKCTWTIFFVYLTLYLQYIARAHYHSRNILTFGSMQISKIHCVWKETLIC